MTAMTAMRGAWAALHVLLLALIVFSIDSLLLKFDHQRADLLPVVLALMLAVALLLRGIAGRVPQPRRHALQRLWGSLDRVGVVWLVLLFVLLMVFQQSFIRAKGDGREYYAQLHSIFINHNLDLRDEARDFGARYAGGFPFGSAILWMPFYAVAHVWLGVLNAFGGAFKQDGYFYPYQMAVGLGTLAYGFAGLVLIYKIACEYFTRWLSLASTIAVCAGSFIVWYVAVDNSYTHGNSLFSVTLFLFLWYRSRAARLLTGWGLLGLSGGLMLMVRWQNALFLAPLAVDVLSAGWHALRRSDRGALVRTLQGAAVASAGLVVGFLPQMYFWKAVYGGWFAVPYYQTGQQWWGDSVMMDVLFSSNHGLFAWHPILYLSVLGTPFLVKRDWRFGLLLLGLFIAQVYVNGAVTTWWGGTAFGGRRFDGCAMFFVLGLAALIQWSERRPAVIWSSVLGALLLVNVFFMQEIASGNLPMGQGIAGDRIVGSLFSRFGNPFSFPANAIFAWRQGSDLALYDRLGLQLFTNVTIDLGEDDDERFLAGGWSAAERGRFGTFRWAVARQSTVGFGLLGPRYIRSGQPQQFADYVLRLRAAPYVFAGSPPQGLQIDVNGRQLVRQTLEPGFREYEFDVPNEFLQRSLNTITFRYDYARSPRELGIRDDPRPLAARFDYIHLVLKARP